MSKKMERLSLVSLVQFPSPTKLLTLSLDEERMTDVIRVMEDGIATVQRIEGGDSKMRLEGFLATFVSNSISNLSGVASYYRFISTSLYRYPTKHWKYFRLRLNSTRPRILHG